jgi:hypothetical protein
MTIGYRIVAQANGLYWLPKTISTFWARTFKWNAFYILITMEICDEFLLSKQHKENAPKKSVTKTS